MNPILLKPEGNARSQVIVMGRPWQTLAAREYYQHKAELWPVVTQALEHLRATYDLVVSSGLKDYNGRQAIPYDLQFQTP